MYFNDNLNIYYDRNRDIDIANKWTCMEIYRCTGFSLSLTFFIFWIVKN